MKKFFKYLLSYVAATVGLVAVHYAALWLELDTTIFYAGMLTAYVGDQIYELWAA